MLYKNYYIKILIILIKVYDKKKTNFKQLPF